MIEKFEKLKKVYKNYIIFIRRGCFYEIYDIDAIIIRDLFNYKVRVVDNHVCVGINVNNINKILIKLDILSINYVIYSNCIIEKCRYKNNCYEEAIEFFID